MSKTDRAKARKGAPKGIPELAPITKPEPQPRSAGKFTRAKVDETRQALVTRCATFGVFAGKGTLEVMAAPWAGSQLGMVLMRECKTSDEVVSLWATWQGFCTAERTYRTRILGQTGSPKGASIAMVRERLEADVTHTIDTRTMDEKDRDAVSGYMRWRGCLGHLDRMDGSMLIGAEMQNGRECWADRAPTAAGLAVYGALKRLHAVVLKRAERKG